MILLTYMYTKADLPPPHFFLCISKSVMTLFNLFDELNDICPFDFPAFARKYFWLTKNRLKGT